MVEGQNDTAPVRIAVTVVITNNIFFVGDFVHLLLKRLVHTLLQTTINVSCQTINECASSGA